jgi:hypothetical protein
MRVGDAGMDRMRLVHDGCDDVTEGDSYVPRPQPAARDIGDPDAWCGCAERERVAMMGRIDVASEAAETMAAIEALGAWLRSVERRVAAIERWDATLSGSEEEEMRDDWEERVDEAVKVGRIWCEDG